VSLPGIGHSPDPECAAIPPLGMPPGIGRPTPGPWARFPRQTRVFKPRRATGRSPYWSRERGRPGQQAYTRVLSAHESGEVPRESPRSTQPGQGASTPGCGPGQRPQAAGPGHRTVRNVPSPSGCVVLGPDSSPSQVTPVRRRESFPRYLRSTVHVGRISCSLDSHKGCFAVFPYGTYALAVTRFDI